MTKKILYIIETAYRGTLEEQDDTVIWLAHAMKGTGSELHVLLQGNAVNYLVKGQDASGLSFGDWSQTQPPNLSSDVAKLMEKGVQVYFIKEDVAQLGLTSSDFISGPKAISFIELPKLLDAHDQVWCW